MKLVRRFITTVISRSRQPKEQGKTLSTRFSHNANRKSTTTTITDQNQPKLLATSPYSSLFKQIVYYPLNSITKLALRAFFQLGSPTNNALLATTSINRALRYSVGRLPTRNHQTSTAENVMSDQTSSSDSKDSDRDQDDNVDPSKSSTENETMKAMENHELGNTLASLREAYARSRKEASSVWLDFANKSCYIYLYRGGGEPNQSLAAFDLDGTLIKPKSNKRIPRSATDWDLFSVWTKIKLQQCLRETQARFVIFTNQNGVGLEIVPLEEVQHRIELVTKRLDIPCTVFVAIEKDIFRKPQTGMFQLFNESFNDSIPVDFSSSFYCGDAIGYPSHSDADIKFAKQLGFPFITPEKFLRGVKSKLVE